MDSFFVERFLKYIISFLILTILIVNSKYRCFLINTCSYPLLLLSTLTKCFHCSIQNLIDYSNVILYEHIEKFFSRISVSIVVIISLICL